MPAPVIRHRPVAVGSDEVELVIPGIRVQGPAVAEHDRLPGPPVLVIDAHAGRRGEVAHLCLLSGGGPPRWAVWDDARQSRAASGGSWCTLLVSGCTAQHVLPAIRAPVRPGHRGPNWTPNGGSRIIALRLRLTGVVSWLPYAPSEAAMSVLLD